MELGDAMDYESMDSFDEWYPCAEGIAVVSALAKRIAADQTIARRFRDHEDLWRTEVPRSGSPDR